LGTKLQLRFGALVLVVIVSTLAVVFTKASRSFDTIYEERLTVLQGVAEHHFSGKLGTYSFCSPANASLLNLC
jgi:hypothetical protein